MTERTKAGGLTHNQRQKFFRHQRRLRDASVNVYMRINDTDARSFRSRTMSAKVMAESARAIYLLLRRT